MDGTSRRLEYFDSLAKNPGYSGTIQTKQEAMASFHAVKCFMKAFPLPLCWFFRSILLGLFLWRIQVIKPSMIVPGIDLIVLDNDHAEQREQVRPTHKKVKGFGALNMTWGNLVVDSILRSRGKQSNHASRVHQMAKRMVKKIRKDYREDVPIVFRLRLCPPPHTHSASGGMSGHSVLGSGTSGPVREAGGYTVSQLRAAPCAWY